MNKMKSTKGITLIALVITIIILLILAGVTINLTIGDNGIFNKVKNATIEYEKAQLKEELEAEIISIQTRKIAEGKEFKREDLSELANIGTIMENLGTPAEGEYKDYFFEVDENYVVTIIGRLKGEKPTISGEVVTEGAVFQGETVEIKITASINDGTIESIEATNGAVLKTDISSTEKVFEVSANGIYYFKAKAENGRSTSIAITIDRISELEGVYIYNEGKNISEATWSWIGENDYNSPGTTINSDYITIDGTFDSYHYVGAMARTDSKIPFKNCKGLGVEWECEQIKAARGGAAVEYETSIAFGYGSGTTGNYEEVKYVNADKLLFYTKGTITEGVPDINKRYRTVLPLDDVTGDFYVGMNCAGYKINVYKIWLLK